MNEAYINKIAARAEMRMRGDIVEKTLGGPFMKAARDEILLDPEPGETFPDFRRRIAAAGGTVEGTADDYTVAFRTKRKPSNSSRPDLAVSGVRKVGMPGMMRDDAGRPVPPSPGAAPVDVRAADVGQARAALGHADAQITAAARALKLQQGGMSDAESVERVMAEQPALYEQYRACKMRLDFLLSGSPLIRA